MRSLLPMTLAVAASIFACGSGSSTAAGASDGGAGSSGTSGGTSGGGTSSSGGTGTCAPIATQPAYVELTGDTTPFFGLWSSGTKLIAATGKGAYVIDTAAPAPTATKVYELPAPKLWVRDNDVVIPGAPSWSRVPYAGGAPAQFPTPIHQPPSYGVIAGDKLYYQYPDIDAQTRVIAELDVVSGAERAVTSFPDPGRIDGVQNIFVDGASLVVAVQSEINRPVVLKRFDIASGASTDVAITSPDPFTYVHALIGGQLFGSGGAAISQAYYSVPPTGGTAVKVADLSGGGSFGVWRFNTVVSSGSGVVLSGLDRLFYMPTGQKTAHQATCWTAPRGSGVVAYAAVGPKAYVARVLSAVSGDVTSNAIVALPLQ